MIAPQPSPHNFVPPARDWRDEMRATLALALPLAGANLLQMMVYSIDVVFVARLGQTALSASSLAVSVFGLLLWTLSGLVGAASPLIAAELGARRHAVREVRRTVRMALWLAVIAGAGGMGLCLLGERLMLATGQDPVVAGLAGDFLTLLMWAMIPSALATVLRNFVSTLGRAGIATGITFLALLVNALGNYMLVFGNWGAPELGLMGSALSSIITSVAMLVAYVAMIFADRGLRRYAVLGYVWRIDMVRLRALVRIGLPIALTILAEAGLFSGAAFLMGRLGPAELAGHTVALQVAALAFQVPFGVAQAATIRVGLGYGAQNHAWIALAARTSFLLGIGFMVLTAGAMWLFPRAILSIYVDVDAARNATMVAFAVQYLAIAAAFQLFDGAQAVLQGSLRGLQDTRMPMVIAIFGYWAAGFGAAIWLGFFTPWRGLGVWAGLLIGLAVVSALLGWRWAMRGRLGLLPAAV